MNAVFSESLLNFRPMDENDLQQVIKIEKLAYLFPWTLGIFNDCLRVGYHAQILELENEMIGYSVISMAVGEAHILNVCVHPNYQGHGFGAFIIESLLKMTSAYQIDTVFLEVRASNQAAIHLYNKFSFNQVGIRRRYYPCHQKEREDALVFALTRPLTK